MSAHSDIPANASAAVLNAEARSCHAVDPRRGLALASLAEKAARAENKGEELAMAAYLQGSSLFNLGQNDESRRELERARELAQQAGRLALVGGAHFMLGGICRDERKLNKADEHYLAGLRIAESCGHDKLRVRVTQGLGMTAGLRGDNKRALDLFRQSLALGQSLNDSELQVVALQNLAIIYHHIGLLDKALDCLVSAQTKLRTGADDNLLCFVLLEQGNVYVQLGARMLALTAYTRARRLAETMDHRLNLMAATLWIGRLLLREGLAAEGLRRLEEALTMAQALGHKASQVEARCAIGEACLIRGDGRRAADELQRSRALMREIEDPIYEAYVHRLTVLCALADEDDGAARAIAAAMEHFRKIGDRANALELHLDLAGKLSAAGQRQRAIRELERALRLARQGGYHDRIVAIHRSLYRLWTRLRNHRKAGDQLEEALAAQDVIAAFERKALLAREALCREFEVEADGPVGVAGLRPGEDRLREVLYQRCATLTPMEEKICILIYAGMRSKEIAPALNIALSTVEWHRGNVRRKLSIPVGRAISAALNSFLNDKPLENPG